MRVRVVVLLLLFIAILVGITTKAVNAGPAAKRGYQFVEGFSHTTIPFRKYQDLIVIQAQMNDSISLNLILDTGTRSLLLYGKKFKHLKNLRKDKKVKVSGWGSPKGVEATLSFPNTIKLGKIMGDQLGVAVVDRGKMFGDATYIDGIIGYELFVRFAVEINYKTSTIHLYDQLPDGHTDNFTYLPLEVNNARPQITSQITLLNDTRLSLKLLVDTGSSLGLALFSMSTDGFSSSSKLNPIGWGLTGPVNGYDLFVREVVLGTMKVNDISTHLVDVSAHPDDQFTFCGSLGAGFLRQHVVIFDYPRNSFFIAKG